MKTCWVIMVNDYPDSVILDGNMRQGDADEIARKRKREYLERTSPGDPESVERRSKLQFWRAMRANKR